MVRKRGAKLEEMIRELFLEHRVEIWPEQQEVRFERYFDDSGKVKLLPGNHVAMGNFYEGLTMGLWGGRMTNRFYIPPKGEMTLFEDNEEIEDEDTREIHLTKPDVIHIKPNGDELVWEAKSWKFGSTCNLSDEQTARYVGIQLTRPKSRINFVFYRHLFQGVRGATNGRTERDLFVDLCELTKYGVVLPLSVILTLHGRGIDLGSDEFVKRRVDGATDAKPFPPCTELRSTLQDRFFRNPEQTIENIGLDSNDYLVDRLKTPAGYRVDGNVLRQIPILVVKDRDYKSWLKRFKEEKLDGVPF